MQIRPPKLPLLIRPPKGAFVFLCLLLLVFVWSWLTGISHQAPDINSMEELVWATSLELGYTKHPPLPSWVMYFAIWLFGREIWLPFFMGMVFSAFGLWFIWKLGCEMTSPYKSFIATLLISVSAYFALRATIYSHNTVQLWSITASIWLFYCALTKDKLRYWFWLGLVCGLSMLTKYSALIQFAAFLLFFIRIGAWRKAKNWYGLALATITCVIVFTPHLFWLFDNNFEPIVYVDASLQSSSYAESLNEIIKSSLAQLGHLSPIAIVLLVWAFWRYRKHDRGPGNAANDPYFNMTIKEPAYFYSFSKYDQQFLLWVGLTPYISTVFISAALGTGLTTSWSSTFFVLAGFYALWLIRGTEAVQMRRIFLIVASIQIIMTISYAVARGPIAQAYGYDARSTYPGSELATLALQHWQEHQPGRPLRVVVANTWLGGNIAVNADDSIRVYIDADDKQSPWFQPGEALACGALIAYSNNGKAPATPALQKLYVSAPWHGTDTVFWSGENGRKIDFNWAVLPATDKCLSHS